jgi:tetratricopeptide (TPR) repeat protein
MLEISKQQAYKYLFESQYELAIPAALQSLKLSLNLFDKNPIELVPCYLILGEACIGMKKFNEAEDYLSLAKWAILKSNFSDNIVKSKLHRIFGQLYASKEEYDKALEQFALNIYHSSLATNPTHTSGTI